MNIQRWDYEFGNYQIIVENAWNISSFTQERITVNGAPTHDGITAFIPLLYWKTMFEDTVLTKDGELDLKVQLRSGLMTVKARLLIAEEVQPWTNYIALKWVGPKGEWPNQDYYDEHS